MNNALLFPPPATRPGTMPHASAVLIYDSFTTAVRGKAFCDQLAGKLQVRCRLDESLWRSDLLGIPAIRQEAARAALSSDFIVIALGGDAELPDGLDRWCGEWMPRAAARDITLVLLFDPATAKHIATDHIRSYLRKAAFAAGVHFFAHTTILPDETPDATVDDIIDPGGQADIAEAAAALTPPPARFPGAHGSTILVVDDYPTLCDMVSRNLEMAGHITFTAHDGEEAQRIVEANPGIDLVITDIDMPKMRGDDLALWLLREHPETRVLLMSAHWTPSLETLGLPLLNKPFGMDSLIATVENVLNQTELV